MNPDYALLRAKDSLIDALRDIVDQLTDEDVRRLELEYTTLKSNGQQEFERLNAQLDEEIEARKALAPEAQEQEFYWTDSEPEYETDTGFDDDQLSLDMPGA